MSYKALNIPQNGFHTQPQTYILTSRTLASAKALASVENYKILCDAKVKKDSLSLERKEAFELYRRNVEQLNEKDKENNNIVYEDEKDIEPEDEKEIEVENDKESEAEK